MIVLYVGSKPPQVSSGFLSPLCTLCLTILGADVLKEGNTTGTEFRYPSYVQNIMGDIFSLGFGPFR